MPTTEEQKAAQHEQDLQRLQKFRLMDDDFLSAFFRDNIEDTELVYKLYQRKEGSYFVNKVYTELGMDFLDENLIAKARKRACLRTQKKGVMCERKYNNSLSDNLGYFWNILIASKGRLAQ